MPSCNRLELGRAAEDAACSHLIRHGLVLLGRNVRYRFGELDLVLRDAGTIVFVEVRRRRASGFGDGAASIDRGKRRRLRLAARAWLAANRELADAACRFDVVSVAGPDDALEIRWIRDAFGGDEG
jgi:putative endonuclease